MQAKPAPAMSMLTFSSKRLDILLSSYAQGVDVCHQAIQRRGMQEVSGAFDWTFDIHQVEHALAAAQSDNAETVSGQLDTRPSNFV